MTKFLTKNDVVRGHIHNLKILNIERVYLLDLFFPVPQGRDAI